MATGPERRGGTGTAVAVRPEIKAQRARRYRVVFYNDDYTTKWFVVDVLERFFHMTEATATAFMLEVHETGRGVAGVYTRDIAETKVAEVADYSKEHGMPLRLDVEPEDDED
jgi:ATP-dependent Clp protease adaptor protein ClpS